MSAQELKPCPNPWCEGAEREGDFSPKAQQRQFGNWQVQCTSCPMDGPIASTEAEAITAWNNRQSALSDAVEIVREYEALMERGFADRHDVERVRNLGRDFLAQGGAP